MGLLRLEALRPRVLAQVSLCVDSGELVFVSGPSGSGKSLLLRAVADLDPHTGEVWLGAEARSAMLPARWRRRVGLLPAEAFWWTDTVGDHFPQAAAGAGASGTPPPSGLPALLSALGFEPDVLDWSVGRLSTGERQRLALARLLAQNPEALLLDEATANLDPSNRERVEQLIGGYRASRAAAVLWVSHDPEQRARLGGRQFGIHDGRLAAIT
ncbi:ATP-binding cassette domain-containing protein [uncultured Lamprocystis sp.]|jgi:ABC-type iron transport system FetAB ATPase subunit|uniref:ABC transporter ATP-binding protein n=1 Tax=uncultured Lamprocystis sp. TaxID=543132 RepID=UPI0025EFA734|nr:ATP-binding cassette domain-containing protein [uncultured Lamprocystis sp.]